MKSRLIAMVVGVMGLGLVGGMVYGQDAAVKKPAAKVAEVPRTEASAVTPAVHSPERHEELMKAKVGSGFDLVFIGDSITDFWPKRGADSWAKFGPYRPLDLGVSGDRTEHVLWRIDHKELEGVNPKACVILIGTNNVGHFDSEKPEWAAAGVKKVLEEVKERMPGTKILLLGVFPRDVAGSPKRLAVEGINRIISTFGDGKDVTYLDIGAKFLDEKGEIPADVMPDKLHPSAKGYEIWYEAMWPTLEKMLK